MSVLVKFSIPVIVLAIAVFFALGPLWGLYFLAIGLIGGYGAVFFTQLGSRRQRRLLQQTAGKLRHGHGTRRLR
jgi:hypothetical protein